MPDPAITVRPARSEDAETIVAMVRELAEYERDPHAVKATAEDFRRDGFSPDRRFEALIATVDDVPAGFALFFHNYSTWEGRAGLYVEDFYIRP